ncbi:MAG: AraC family transcriptional regulator [Limnochordia bacterium]
MGNEVTMPLITMEKSFSMKDIPSSFINKFDKFAFEFNRLQKQHDMQIFHFHDYYEIYYLVSGERDYFIDNRTYHVKPGNIVLINRGVIHRTIGSSPKGYERALFYYEKEFEEEINRRYPNARLFSVFNLDLHVFSLSEQDQQFVNEQILKIAKECLERPENHESYLEVLFIELLFYLKRCISDSLTAVPQVANPKMAKISDIIAFLNDNYMKRLSLPLITEKFFISTSCFTKTFKEATGFTFVEYLNNLRIKHAQYMLRGTDLTVSEIAERVGFDSVTHFGRVFKKYTGISPLAYRKDKK